MTALEAIPKITELIGLLIKRIKDRETFQFVQQIQEHQLIVHQGLMDAQTQILDLKRKICDMESDHTIAITAIKEAADKEIAQRDARIAELKQRNLQAMDDELSKRAEAGRKSWERGRLTPPEQLGPRR
jgi:hypothetical protein